MPELMDTSLKPKTLRLRRVLAYLALGLVILCLGGATLSALSNRNLPAHSTVVDRLSEADKATLNEVIHLRKTLGDTAWPGWAQADIPIILYNEAYAFLTGYPDPPAGWTMMPRQESRGGAWEAVPGEPFNGQPYYRQRLLDPKKTPENFTVLVGERWVATFQTREYEEVAFYQGFREELPPFLSRVLPLRLAWRFLMGKTENTIGALEHESFHAYQGSVAPNRLAAAENVMVVEANYPFDSQALDEAWKSEMGVLLQAAQAKSEGEARQLARKFLQQRQARRAAAKLSGAQVDFERQREWLEGLAKYAELELGRLAGATASYQPDPALSGDPAFKKYGDRESFWSEQLGEAKKTQGRSGETRFYYSGNALAVTLDRLAPGWKNRALTGGQFLEDLLQEAVQ